MKKNRFPLILKDDFPAKTIEDVKEHFDIKRLEKYAKSGELLTWLQDRYYEDEVEQLSGFDMKGKDLSQNLCTLFGMDPKEHISEAELLKIQKAAEKQKKKEETKAAKAEADVKKETPAESETPKPQKNAVKAPKEKKPIDYGKIGIALAGGIALICSAVSFAVMDNRVLSLILALIGVMLARFLKGQYQKKMTLAILIGTLAVIINVFSMARPVISNVGQMVGSFKASHTKVQTTEAVAEATVEETSAVETVAETQRTMEESTEVETTVEETTAEETEPETETEKETTVAATTVADDGTLVLGKTYRVDLWDNEERIANVTIDKISFTDEGWIKDYVRSGLRKECGGLVIEYTVELLEAPFDITGDDVRLDVSAKTKDDWWTGGYNNEMTYQFRKKIDIEPIAYMEVGETRKAVCCVDYPIEYMDENIGFQFRVGKHYKEWEVPSSLIEDYRGKEFYVQ